MHKEVLMQVYIGIDWSEQKHDVVFMNAAGATIAQFEIPHSAEGFLQFDETRWRMKLGTEECVVGLETAHNLLIDFLWSRGYSKVYVVPPTTVKSNRKRFSSSAARSDPGDAIVIADSLRTDHGRLQPWHPDSLLTRQIQTKVSLINHLTKSAGRLSNRLRAVLLRYYPAVLNMFSSWPTKIALEFIRTFPTPEDAENLSPDEFQRFARQHRYPNPKRLPACFARLQLPQPEATQDTVEIYKEEAVLLATMLLTVMRAKQTALRELKTLFREHPDHAIFDSLPGAGDFLAPALLAKFGDDRKRFPTPASVQALAGTCPVTDQSGKRRIIKFRRACDREFRAITQQWSIASLERSVWANAYWQRTRTRCRYSSLAYRRLANRWLAIAWKLWQTGQIYDEAYHLQQRALRSKRRR
jgi:transposase